MQKILKVSFTFAVLLFAASCSNSKKDGDASINDKKVQLEKLKTGKEKQDEQIRKLQEELAKIDTSSSNPAKIKLVALSAVTLQPFDHYIDLQGKVDAENISYISPRGMGGQVKAVFVKLGDHVRKGQLLLKLDDAIQRQQVLAAKQQATGVNTQLTLAKSLYQRQKNLWDQGIGTEVQLLTSQTNVTTLQNQLSQIAAQVRVAQEQLNTSNIYSDVNGIADVVNIRVGETFTGVTAAGPQIKIVNTSSLKAVSNIPENYLGVVGKNIPVIVELPDLHRTFNTKVSFVGSSIDLINRGFVVEAKLPSDAALKPNQIALMRIKDYASPHAIAVPLNTLQNDEKGKFVMVAGEEKGKMFARKRPVTIGMLNGDILEIKSGLKEGDMLVTEGFGNLYEGQQITTASK
ncbi:MAG: efflux RND transporter periplasmic adaptor subunit [Ferruginibacter sp.]